MTPRQQTIKLVERYKQIEIDFSKANNFARIKLLTEVAQISQNIFDLGYSLPQLIYKRQLREIQNANDKSIKSPFTKVDRRD